MHLPVLYQCYSYDSGGFNLFEHGFIGQYNCPCKSRISFSSDEPIRCGNSDVIKVYKKVMRKLYQIRSIEKGGQYEEYHNRVIPNFFK